MQPHTLQEKLDLGACVWDGALVLTEYVSQLEVDLIKGMAAARLLGSCNRNVFGCSSFFPWCIVSALIGVNGESACTRAHVSGCEFECMRCTCVHARACV